MDGSIERRRIVEWQDPMPAAKAASGLAGLDYLRRIATGEIPPPPIAQTLGFTLLEVAEGSAVFAMVPGEHHYNPLGSVHGGVFATLLDSAMGCAVHTTMPAGRAYTTLEMKVNIVRALTRETKLVRAEGKIIHVGRQMATAEARIVDEAGRLYAHGTTTCLVFEIAAKA